MAFPRENPLPSGVRAPGATPCRGRGDSNGRRAVATPLPRRARPLALALLVAVALGCETYVEGNGVFGTSDRSGGVAPFAGVRVEDAIQATVTVSAGSEKQVEVSGDANLLEYIRTEVLQESVLGENVEVLRITVVVPGGSYSPKIPIRAVVQMPSVRYLSAREGARVTAGGATAPDLALDASGGGGVVVAGAGGPELHATVRDATFDAGAYPVEHAGVMLWGHSHAKLSAALVSGEAHGSSAVENLLATGACEVILFDTAAVECPPAP
jgi:hypothetical protein